jgi:hypothetical protein
VLLQQVAEPQDGGLVRQPRRTVRPLHNYPDART